jgi:hypothetical protein
MNLELHQVSYNNDVYNILMLIILHDDRCNTAVVYSEQSSVAISVVL